MSFDQWKQQVLSIYPEAQFSVPDGAGTVFAETYVRFTGYVLVGTFNSVDAFWAIYGKATK